ncbi:MAG: biopolymer transporter ExbD [Psychroserpens sp.]|uniref:ExbD/TolR family protein n=1 Tax=Psychroserpens sp. TaxID=2020870 RepID=UPI003C884D2C
MKTFRRQSVEVNAGSMADIAFLLLIFFLVTATIPNDMGIQRKLPAPCPNNEDCGGEIHKRNVLEIMVSAKNELLVDSDIIPITQLKDIAKAFIDNNGDMTCSYCDGLMKATASDHPAEAVISLKNDPLTAYDFYIKVQDELTKAYTELREQYAKTIFEKPLYKLTKGELQIVKAAYPFILSEVKQID